MKQAYILNIDNPCKEEWNKMKHQVNGKFCSSCSKTVIDFTTLTDSEIVKLLEKNTGRLCGNLNTDQLNRIISIQENKSTPIFYKFLAGLLLFGSTKNVQSANINSNKTEISTSIYKEELLDNEIEYRENPDDSLTKFIQGIVLDSATKEPLIGVIIKLKNTNKAVATDIEGKFKITILDSLLSDSLALKISCIGYKTKEFAIDKTKFPIINEQFIMELTGKIMGEIIYIKHNKKKWWQGKNKINKNH
jgi:hypothetical protein